MIGFFLFIALFPAMLHTAQQPQTYERAAALEALQAWPTRNEVEDWFWLLLSVLAAVLLWPSRLLWRGILAVSRFDLTEFICRLFGAGFDPDGCKLPEWNYQPSTSNGERAFEIRANEYIEANGETVAIWDGVVYKNATIKEGKSAVNLTQAEIEAIADYKNPTLKNLTTASGVKEWLAKGKSDYEIGLLVGCGQSYARHYRLALQKANLSPTE